MDTQEFDELALAMLDFFGGRAARDAPFLITNEAMATLVVHFAVQLREDGGPMREALGRMRGNADRARRGLVAQASRRGETVDFEGRKLSVITEAAAQAVRNDDACPNFPA